MTNRDYGIVLNFHPVSTSSSRTIFHYLITYVKDGDIRQALCRRRDVKNLAIEHKRITRRQLIEELNEAYNSLQAVIATYNPATDYYLCWGLTDDYNYLVKKVPRIVRTQGQPESETLEYIAGMHILEAKIP